MRTSKVQTPMLDKMRSVKEDSQKIGAFIDWLNENAMHICAQTRDERYGEDMTPIMDPIEKLLVRYFEIDLDKVEAERCALLDELRADGR